MMDSNQVVKDQPQLSRAGRIGFVLSLLNLFGVCLSFGFFIYIMANELRTGEAIEMFSVALFFIFFLLSLVALVLSLMGIIQPGEKKAQSIVGAILSLASMLALGVPVLLWLREMI